jgi:hypothetical protein
VSFYSWVRTSSKIKHAKLPNNSLVKTLTLSPTTLYQS